MAQKLTNKKTRLSYWQEEVDAAFLYSKLSEAINDAEKSKRYDSLSIVENKHVLAWEKLLKEEGVTIPKKSPTSKAELKLWLSRRFGMGLLEQMMLQKESKEVKSYISLYKKSTHQRTQQIALTLARDSASHANKLTEALDKDFEPWHNISSGGILRDVIYGFNDGLTANFGLIAAIIGAKTNNNIILISGIAGLIADALSMGASGYLAAKSEQEVLENKRQMEADEILLMPEIETEELALIYESWGNKKNAARYLAEEVMKEKDKALEEKMTLELGISAHPVNRIKEAWLTGVATAIGAFIPVAPFFLWEGTMGIIISFSVSMLAHFGVGAARSVFKGRNLFRSEFDMFIVGFGFAAFGYIIGEFIIKFL